MGIRRTAVWRADMDRENYFAASVEHRGSKKSARKITGQIRLRIVHVNMHMQIISLQLKHIRAFYR